MSLHEPIRQRLQSALAQPADDSVAQLDDALRLLCKWRSVLIQNTLLQQQGTVVMQGPLQGMDFLPQSAEGCHIAKLLGCYEQPLSPYIEQAIQANYPTNMPDWFNNLAHLDQLLATWEWRSGPTPWLVMKVRAEVGVPA